MPKKILISLITFIILSVIIFFRFPRSAPPSIKPEEIKIVDIEEPEKKKNQNLSLRVLSVNLIGEFEQPAVQQAPTAIPTASNRESTPSASINPQESRPTGTAPSPTITPPPPKLKSLRLLGEVENNGDKTVSTATPLVTFFDAGNYKLAAKVAAWSDSYFFPILKPQEKFLYDIIVKDLPENFANISLSFTPSKSSSPQAFFPISQTLKLQERNIEEKSAAGTGGNGEIYYYTLRSQMINTGAKPVKNARVVAYAKDAEGKVFAWNKQEFPSDLFSPQQTQSISINLLPVKNGRLEQLEVFLFGDEL